MTTGNIFLAIFYGVWLCYFLYRVGESISLGSTRKIYKPIRKLYWVSVRNRLKKFAYEYSLSKQPQKLGSFMAKYINESIALRQIYFNYGYDKTNMILAEKRDEYYKQLEEMKYNTFDNLSYDENKFIDDYLKKKKT